ncbi:rRNA maturation RNase YbeY [uncultured Thioclava sp.]|uniref:rRNA maturation RNase YbeY n=1 Tax=uncultured Thioclava sp. TaxID=473858 RepID=UPI0025D4A54C|nr:rRNA maturation RNase YbeY [uncultured Thioclava sp.]
MDIDIEIEAPAWEALDLPALVAHVAPLVLRDRGLDPDICTLSILACDDARIAELNADFRAKPQATNVLSWPAQERGADQPGAEPDRPAPDVFGEIALGDVAIAYETCQREAADQGKPIENHVTHLIIHAILHLLGYDHIHEQDAQLMEQIEVRLLENEGIVNPYGQD